MELIYDILGDVKFEVIIMSKVNEFSWAISTRRLYSILGTFLISEI
jgi:hypothetical protein